MQPRSRALAQAGEDGTRFKAWPMDDGTFSTLAHGRVRHDLHGHPLFQLPELERLAHDLAPLGQCRFVRPDVTQSSAFRLADRHPAGLGLAEVFRRMEEPGSWIALYNVEAVPRYRALLGQILDSVRPLVQREQGRIVMETGFVFISAPPSVTPFHIDRENNLWLQLHGRKVLTVWRDSDRSTVPAAVVEDFIVTGATKAVRLQGEMRARGEEHDVGPGDGVYFPSTSPHMTRSDRSWVTPGDGVSVSIGVNFYTEATRRAAQVHQVNRLLRRRLGVSPRSTLLTPTWDPVKAPIGSVLGAARQLSATLRSPWIGRVRAGPPPPVSY